MKSLLTVEEAREEILKAISPLPAERVSLLGASGRYLAESIQSPVDIPAFDNAAIDGYALRWEDLSPAVERGPVCFNVLDDIPAGVVSESAIGPNQTARIMTGAQVPYGANTVVRREATLEEEDTIAIDAKPTEGYGANIRQRGAYLKRGELLMDVGHRITAGDVALLISTGATIVSVHAPPRVAVISTGDELVEIGAVPGPGQVVNSSGVMLAELIRQAGGIPIVLPVTRDRHSAILSRFEEALAVSDAVVSIGGVSVGERDLVRSAMQKVAGEITFWKVKMVPGRPLAFGQIGNVPLIGVPGNPVSSFVSFYQFVRPALLRMQGAKELTLPRHTAILTRKMRADKGSQHFMPGRLRQPSDGPSVFTPSPNQSAGNLRILVGINAFGIFKEDREIYDVGETISVDWIC